MDRSSLSSYFNNNNNNNNKLFIIHNDHLSITVMKYSRGNKCRFWQVFVEAIKEFPIVIIQSKTSVSTHEYSESGRASIAH